MRTISALMFALAFAAGCGYVRSDRAGTTCWGSDCAAAVAGGSAMVQSGVDQAYVHEVERPQAQARAYARVRAADRTSDTNSDMRDCIMGRATACAQVPDWDQVARVTYAMSHAERISTSEDVYGFYGDAGNTAGYEFWQAQAAASQPQSAPVATTQPAAETVPMTSDQMERFYRNLARLNRRLGRQERDLTTLSEIVLRQRTGGRQKIGKDVVRAVVRILVIGAYGREGGRQ